MIDSLKADYQGKIKVTKSNADASKRLIRDLNIISVPHLVLYQDGNIIFSHSGVINKEELIDLFDKNINNLSAK